jgi:F-type H+-transporting ATPase subunit epsilon
MVAATLKLKIITPESLLVETLAKSVTLPLADGEVTILPEHEAYIGLAKPGEIIFKNEEGKEESFALAGGFIEFHNNVLVVMADAAEAAAEIDIERAEAAKKRAEELMNSPVEMDEEAYRRTSAILERELARLRVAKKHASHRGILPSSD